VIEKQTKDIRDSQVVIEIQGSVRGAALKNVSCYVNGKPYKADLDGGKWSLAVTYEKSERDDNWKRWRSPALYQTIVLVIAHTETGAVAGQLVLL
jgi:hypothetical protein